MDTEVTKFTMPPPMVPQVAEQPRTLMDTIHEAVMRGLSIDVINNMVVLHKQFAADAAKRDFDDAFAKAKAEIKVVDKDAHVGFKSKDKDKADTDYDHDTLAGIYAAAVPALSKYGLSHSFDVDQVMLPGDNPGEFTQRITVTCIISGLGHSKQVKMSGPPDTEGKKTGLKAIASTVTMLSRYTLRAALGLASRKDKSDDDGAAAEGIDQSVPETISEAQLEELIKLADDVEANKAAFCGWLSRSLKIDVKGFADIRECDFETAKRALEMKRGTLRVRGDGVAA
jgi:ERF superfamily